MTSVLFAGSVGFTKENKEITIVGIGKATDQYWRVVETGFNDAAKIMNIKSIFYCPPSEDIEAQMRQIETFAAMGVDGIVFAPSSVKPMIPLIKRAMSQGINCITFDCSAPETGAYLHIGWDVYKIGLEMGEGMAKILKGKGKIVEGTGSMVAESSVLKHKGFVDALAKYPEIEIVEVLNDDADQAKAVSLAEAAFRAHPDLRDIYPTMLIMRFVQLKQQKRLEWQEKLIL